MIIVNAYFDFYLTFCFIAHLHTRTIHCNSIGSVIKTVTLRSVFIMLALTSKQNVAHVLPNQYILDVIPDTSKGLQIPSNYSGNVKCFRFNSW